VDSFNIMIKEEAEMDHENPHHRLKDKELGDKLGTTECQQQLLTWLVKGAVAWQRQGLPLLSDKMKVAMQSYVAENDHLQDFLDQSCELGAGFEGMTTRFHDSFNVKQPVSDKQLVKIMQNKGFIKLQSRNPSFPRRAMVWQGVRIRESVRMYTKLLTVCGS